MSKLKSEVTRLTACLKFANDQTEEFERKWYLACDEAETLCVERDALKAKVVELTAVAQRDVKHGDKNNFVVFGGRCAKHPLQMKPCQTCLAKEKFQEQGLCPECEGSGEQGGQFCGGYWKCDSCQGSGKYETKPDA